ncbi:MAG: DUF5812 family protein [Haloarculaceae archaeon]
MKTTTFLVTDAAAEAATLRDVTDGQVVTLSEHPDLEAGEVIEATVRPEPPLEVAYEVVDIDERREIPVEHVEEGPTRRTREVAADQPIGELTRRERAGDGEIHVLTVPAGGAADAAATVVDDEATVERAARLGVVRVEVRSAETTEQTGNGAETAGGNGDHGVVSVRYLPD